MIELSPVGRAGTPDEVGTVGAFLMCPDGAFNTGSDFLTDGGVTASYFYGELSPQWAAPSGEPCIQAIGMGAVDQGADELLPVREE
jgi:Enoyl-(Acyl carrier protein) reductase